MILSKNYKNTALENCRAKPGLRFANYIIDLAFFYFIAFCLGFIIRTVLPNVPNSFDYDEVNQLTFLLLYGITMSFIEGLSNGKSIGKLITRTRSLNDDGSAISLADAFRRNIFRAIPFIAFSALSAPCIPWHDRLSYTMVIEEKKILLFKRKLIFLKSIRENPEFLKIKFY